MPKEVQKLNVEIICTAHDSKYFTVISRPGLVVAIELTEQEARKMAAQFQIRIQLNKSL